MNIQFLCEKYFGTENIYEIFGIKNDASEKESEYKNKRHEIFFNLPFDDLVKNKYRLLILENHPDKGNSRNASSSSSDQATTEKFQLIKTLYDVLMNPGQRESYDQSGTIIASVATGLSTEPIFVTESQILTCMEEYAGEFNYSV